MTEKTDSQDPSPRPLSLLRLVTDQARVTKDVLEYTYPGSGTDEDPYIIRFIPNDAGNPMNWTKSRRWIISVLVSTELLATTFASSVYSGPMRELYMDFRASTLLLTGGISLFVLGFALGPLLWAPLSEIYGRQIVFFITFAAFTAFSAASTGSPNVASLLVLRFFAGAFGSSPFTNAGGVIADVFTAAERGAALGVFALAPCFGPTIGPLAGGFLGQAQGWKWVMGMTTIFIGLMWIMGSVLVPETYAPVILRRRVDRMTKMTGKIYMLEEDKEKGRPSILSLLPATLIRPWILLFREPIVLLLSIYSAIVYGTLYLLFGAYPVVFQKTRGWSEGIGGLPFLGVAGGMIIGVLFCAWSNKWYLAAAERAGGIAPPEARLVPAFFGAIAVPVGMFWFAWTCSPSIHWISAVLAGAPFGFGFVAIFLGVTSYLIDSYTIFAASVLAANTVLRSLFGAAFPLFTPDMYDNLGINWASSIPGFLALACVPFPFIFYKYGAAIRSRCVYAAQAEATMDRLRAKAADVVENEAAQQEKQDRHDSSGFTSDETEVETDDSKRTSSDESDDPKWELRHTQSRTSAVLDRIASRRSSMAEAANYNSSPYDIDRTNTASSLAGVDRHRERSGSVQR